MADETLMTDGQDTQVAGEQQSASAQPESQSATGEQATQQQQATKGDGSESQQAEGSKTESEQVKPEGAPEKYEFKPTEGSTFDDAVLGAYSEVAKELNLPQDAAQKVLDKMGPVIAARQAERISEARNQWSSESKADKEIGGAKFDENMAVAKRAREAFASKELVALLDATGLGDHPEVNRLFYRAGSAISEDGFVGRGQSPTTKSALDVLYDNSSK